MAAPLVKNRLNSHNPARGVNRLRFQMELCPVTDAAGYAEMFWKVRDLFRRALSERWIHQIGTVEGYEFLAAKNNGWLVVYYSYDYDGQWYAGELRRWLLINTSDRQTIGVKAQTLYPQGSRIAIRVNPRAPDVSIVVAGDN